MADISKMKNATTGDMQDIKDATAREQISELNETLTEQISQLNSDISAIDIFSTGTALDTGCDLNDITTNGKYYSGSGTISSSMLNVPSNIDSGFSLFVITVASVWVGQIIIAGNNQWYYRACNRNTGTLAEWHQISMTILN